MDTRVTPGRVVFLGDIPYEMTTEQIQEMAASIGPVLNFRLVYNNETKRSRGYGFIEYKNIDSAVKAVHTFHNMPLKGRILRADFSHEKSGGSFFSTRDGMPLGSQGQNQGQSQRDQNQGQSQRDQNQNYSNNYNTQKLPFHGYNNSSMPFNGSSFGAPVPPPQPQAKYDVPQNLIVNDNISRTLSHLPPPRLMELISTLKMLVVQDASTAHTYFQKNMDVTYAVVQAMLLMGLVDAKVVTEAASGGANLAVQQDIQQPPVHHHSSVHHQPPVHQQQQQHRMNSAPPPPPPPPSDPLANMDSQQAALIQQVLDLTDEQIMYLPPDQKTTILQLRDRYRRGIFS